MSQFFIFRISGSTVPWTCLNTCNSLDVELSITDIGSIVISKGDQILGFQVSTGTINYLFTVKDVVYSLTGDSVTLTLEEQFLQANGVPFNITKLNGTTNGEICEIDNQTFDEIVSLFGAQGLISSCTQQAKATFQRIYLGAPGTGKSTEAERFATDSINGIGAIPTDIIRTTFHPATDYASFVGCYKPESYDDPSCPGKSLIKYEYCPQPFIQAYTRAWDYKENTKTNAPVVLLIEEINRANCAQAFGDVFQMLDRTIASAITPEKSLEDYLKKYYPFSIKNGKMCLPDNLSILATMNTSDQSLFPIDSAFLRRWERIYIRINYSGVTENGTPTLDPANLKSSANLILTFGDKSYKWIDFLSKINKKISDVQQDEKKLGNYAIKENISTEKFIGGILSYLWDSVCKDLDIEDDTYFLRNGNDNNKTFKFWDIVDLEKDSDRDGLMQGFMKYLDVKEIPYSVLAAIPSLAHLVPPAPQPSPAPAATGAASPASSTPNSSSTSV